MGDEALLSRTVAMVHSTDLREANVGFVHDDQILLRVAVKLIGACCKEIQEAIRALARFTSVKVQRVVLHGLTVPDLPEHFEVVFGFLLQTVAFEFLALPGKPFASLVEFGFDGFEGGLKALRAGHEEFLGVNPRLFKRVQSVPRHGVTNLDALDAIQVEDNP